MQSSPSRRPGKRLENMIFFFPSYFLNTHGRPSRSPWGWTPVEGGQDVPSSPRSCARATSVPGGGAGQNVPTAPLRVLGRDLRAEGVEEDPSWREQRLSGHPPGSTCSQLGEQRRRLQQSVSGEIRTLCEVIRVFPPAPRGKSLGYSKLIILNTTFTLDDH